MNNKVDYLNNPWSPAKQTIFQNDNWAGEIDTIGYKIVKLISDEQLQQLNELFISQHDLSTEEGGMFYSVYSQNVEYRKNIHDMIGEILRPTLESVFKDYRVVLNSFVVKEPGPKSEFSLHQDTTGLDETKYSPLNFWIPLHSVTEESGCLGILPYSHRFFTPYRSISFPTPFDHIAPMVKKYLQPVEMQAGEVLIFDNRLVHHSYRNSTSDPRIAIVCGLFPQEATMQTCFKPNYELGGTVEFIDHDDNFLIENINFLVDCQARPRTGVSADFKVDPYHEISELEFKTLCERHGLSPINENISSSPTDCHLIQEPFSETEL